MNFLKLNKKSFSKFLNKSLSLFVSFAVVFSFVPGLSEVSVANATESDNSDEIMVAASQEENLGGRLKSASELQAEVEQSDETGAISLVEPAKTNATASSVIDSALDSGSSLPSKLDLREKGVVSSVKSQNPWGDCWAFASNAASEISVSTALGKTSGTSDINFSSYQTAWFGETRLSSDASTLSGTAKSQAGEGAYPTALNDGYVLDTGGMPVQAATEFAQGIGVTNVSDMPYQTTNGDRSYRGEWSLSDDLRNLSVLRLSKYNNLGTVNNGAFYNYSTNESVLTAIKSELNKGHGVTLLYRSANGNSQYMHPTNWAQYNNGSSSTETKFNHAVCVVGYDDNYSASNFREGAQPSSDGAFIIKNSWGSKTGEAVGDSLVTYNWGIDGSGYFYLSYYDHSISSCASFEFDMDTYTPSHIDTDKEIIDQYDYLQANGVNKNSYHLKDSDKFDENCVGWYSNVYTASQSQSLHHIGVWFCYPGQTLTYKVYRLTDDATSPDQVVSETPDAQGTYSGTYEGFVRLKLDNEITLKAGEKYAIWISQGGAYGANQNWYAFPRVYQAGDRYSSELKWTSTSVVNEGESFISKDSAKTWTSVTSTTEDGGWTNLDNYCVKGYATVLNDPKTVKFDTGNGGSYVADQLVEKGQTVSEPATNPTRENYIFSGWYSNSACTTQFNFATPITADTTIYAKWTPATYSITYNYGYTNPTKVTNPSSYTYGTGTSTLASPTRSGYNFAGWYLNGVKTDKISELQSGDVELVANWTAAKYTITYYTGIGDNGSNPSEYEFGVGVGSFADAVAPTGYTFAGWFSNASLSSRITTISSTSMGNYTLYAKYTKISYSIEYVSSTTLTSNTNPSSYTVTDSVTLVEPSVSAVGKIFLGWYTDSTYKTEATGIESGTIGNKTFYAAWADDKNPIYYHLNAEDAANAASNPSEYTSGIGVTSFADPSRPNYDFAGWYSDELLSTKVTSISTTQRGAVDLYAKWTPKVYTITYHPNCDDAVFEDGYYATKYTYGVGVDRIDMAEVERLGYYFCGWYDSTLTTRFGEISETASGNLDLYADWSIETYSIGYEYDAAPYPYDRNPNPTSFYYEDGTITLQPLENIWGYEFVGWYADSEKTIPITTIDKRCAKNVMVYAKFTDNTYFLRVNATGGNVYWTVGYSGDYRKVSSENRFNSLIGDTPVPYLYWKPEQTSSGKLKWIKSAKVNGKVIYSSSSVDKSVWKTTNSEYKRRMKQTVNVINFDTVCQEYQQIDIPGSLTANVEAGSDLWVDVEFEEVTPVYRLYNMITSEHLFTSNKTEYDNWVAKCKKDQDFWIGEGIDWFAPSSYDKSTTKEVYRLYNAGLGAMGRSSHYYSSNLTEIAKLKKMGWKVESGQGYNNCFFLSQQSSGVPIYTCYNEALGSAHHYTSNKSEWSGLSKHGWDLEKTKNGTTGVFGAKFSAS